jgi:cytochrome P450
VDLAKWCPDTANRDPKEFPNPDEFRLGRDLPSHVGFGAGIHYRLGAPLVRAGDEVTLDTLLDRFSTIRHARISCAYGKSKPERIDVYRFLFDFEGDKIRNL